jgi:hypothetical protein
MMNKLMQAALAVFGMASFAPTVATADMISTFHDPYHQTAPALFVDEVNAPLTVEDFTNSFHYPIGYTLNTNTSYSSWDMSGNPIHPGDIQPGVTYTAVKPDHINSAYDRMGIRTGGGYSGGYLQGVRSTPLTITFDHATSAFGFFSNTDYGSLDVRINFTSGQSYDASLDQFVMYQGFFGFVSDSADIASVVLSPPNQRGEIYHVSLDNFTFANVAAVPEPGSALLAVCGGLGVIGFRAARRRR